MGKQVYEINELENVMTPELEKKWQDKFQRYAVYKGNGIYEIGGVMSTDTRELFTMYVALREHIPFKVR